MESNLIQAGFVTHLGSVGSVNATLVSREFFDLGPPHPLFCARPRPALICRSILLDRLIHPAMDMWNHEELANFHQVYPHLPCTIMVFSSCRAKGTCIPRYFDGRWAGGTGNGRWGPWVPYSPTRIRTPLLLLCRHGVMTVLPGGRNNSQGVLAAVGPTERSIDATG